jgi:TolB-like protein
MGDLGVGNMSGPKWTQSGEYRGGWTIPLVLDVNPSQCMLDEVVSSSCSGGLVMNFARFLFAFHLIFASLYSSEKTRIAVLPVEAKTGVDPSVAVAVSDLLGQELVNLRKFTVVERMLLQQVMKEQALQQSGCTEQSCAVKLGNLLNVQKIVAGSVTRLGLKHIISVNLIDVERGQVEMGEKFSVVAIEDILQNVTVLAARLGERAQVFGTLIKQSERSTWLVNLGLNDGVRPGQKLLAVRYGKAIINQANGELLGRETRELGELSIIRVDPLGEFSIVKPMTSDMREGDRVYLPLEKRSQEYVTTMAGTREDSSSLQRASSSDDLASLHGLETMIKSRQFMRDDQKHIAIALTKNLMGPTRSKILSQKKMSAWGYFVGNFFIPSLGSYIQGDRVAGGVAIAGLVLGAVITGIGVDGMNSIPVTGLGIGVLLVGLVANYGGPFMYSKRFNDTLQEILQVSNSPNLRFKTNMDIGATIHIPIVCASF